MWKEDCRGKIWYTWDLHRRGWCCTKWVELDFPCPRWGWNQFSHSRLRMEVTSGSGRSTGRLIQAWIVTSFAGGSTRCKWRFLSKEKEANYTKHLDSLKSRPIGGYRIGKKKRHPRLRSKWERGCHEMIEKRRRTLVAHSL